MILISPKSLKNLKILTLLIVITCLFLTSRPVVAQQISLSLSPPIVELAIKPGKSVLIAYDLKNNGDPTELNSFIRSFEPKGQDGKIHIQDSLDGPVRFNLDNAQIQLEQPFFIKSHESQQLLLKIRIPEGTPEGDYYYTLLVESNTVHALGDTSAGLAKATIGTNILISVTSDGTTQISSRISELSILPHFNISILGKKFALFDSGDTIPIRLVVANTGNNRIKPQGTVTFHGPLQSTVSYDILPQNILEHSDRLLHATPSADLSCPDTQSYACKYPTSLMIPGFFIGKYGISTEINFGSDTPSLFSNATFYVIPIKYAIGMLITAFIVIIIIKKIKNKED